LTEVRSFTWGEFSLPTSVGVRYGQKDIWLEAFLDGVGPGDFRLLAQTRPSGDAGEIGICLDLARSAGSPSCPFDGFTSLTASPPRSSRCFLVQDYLTCLPSPTTTTSSA